MSLSPLIIQDYHLQKLVFRLKPGFEVNSANEFRLNFQPTIDVNAEYNELEDSPGSYRVELDVTFEDDEDFPYDFEIGYVGFFRVEDDFPESKKELLVQVNGPSILYSAAREFVNIVTALSPYRQILLPSVSFVMEQLESKPKIPKPPIKKKKLPKPQRKIKKTRKE